MKKINPIPKQVPLRQVPFIVGAIDNLPPEILDYKLNMDAVQVPVLEFGQDDEGYFIRATEIYRLVK